MSRWRDEGGSITLWVLGLCVMMLFVGGIALDLWRAFSERRALAGMVDAAAVAGSSGIDTSFFRETSQLRLDPSLAEELAVRNLEAQQDDRALTDARVVATPEEITVNATGQVEFTLLCIFMADEEPFSVSVSATADPRRSP